MLKPSAELTKDLKISTYSLVVGIAKKAREIAEDAEIKGEILIDKPVDMAVQEYIDHDFEIVETEPCEECGRLDCICNYREEPKAQDEPEEKAEEPEETQEEEADAADGE